MVKTRREENTRQYTHIRGWDDNKQIDTHELCVSNGQSLIRIWRIANKQNRTTNPRFASVLLCTSSLTCYDDNSIEENIMYCVSTISIFVLQSI